MIMEIEERDYKRIINNIDVTLFQFANKFADNKTDSSFVQLGILTNLCGLHIDALAKLISIPLADALDDFINGLTAQLKALGGKDDKAIKV